MAKKMNAKTNEKTKARIKINLNFLILKIRKM